MKTRTISVTIIFLFFTILLNAQFTSIPDFAFEWQLMGLGYDDVEDGYVLTANIASINSLDVSNFFIGDLTGIEDFVSLEVLLCHSNSIASLDLSQNLLLTELSCHNNLLTSLDISQNTALIELNCHHNQLASLDITQNTALTTLYCDYNQLTSLDVSQNTTLIVLSCGYNQLANLNVTQNTAMGALFCYDNQLADLDISLNTEMTFLDCRDNELVSLDVHNGNNASLLSFNATLNPSLACIQVDNETDANAGLPPYHNWQIDPGSSYSEDCMNLEKTYIPDDNFEQALIDLGYDDVLDDYVQTTNISGITSLDVAYENIGDLTGIEYFNSLEILNCSDNLIHDLDVSQNTALIHLYCWNNDLEGLDVTQNLALTNLNCHENQIMYLDVTQNTLLTELRCFNNLISSLDLTQNTALTNLLCGINYLESLDVSQNPALDIVGCMNNPPLTSLNMQNGNNSKISTLLAINNPLLTCILVDNEIETNEGLPPYNNWQKDPTSSYLEECNSIYIPDPNFEQALIDLDIDSDGSINQHILRTDAESVTLLNISNPTENASLPNVTAKIADLTGIEAFVNLTALYCGRNELTSLNLSTLENLLYLHCEINELSSLDLSNNPLLVRLYCYYNQIDDLTITQNTALTKLWCYNNQLTSLDATFNNALTELSCLSNQLTGLDLSQNTLLAILNCEDNLITSLDVSQNTALVELNCGANQLSSLDVTYNTNLEELVCYNNDLTSLDITQNTLLQKLVCMWNEITILDCSQNEYLVELACLSNVLTELDMRNGNNHNITAFNAAFNNLYCINVDDETADHSGWTVDAGVIFSNSCNYNTQGGFDVVVIPIDPFTGETPAEAVFDWVTESGNTTVEMTEIGPEIPDGFENGQQEIIYNIETTAQYDGDIQIGIDYDEADFGDESVLRLMHYETDHWEDITTNVDAANNTIYGISQSLSPFAILEDVQPTVIETIDAPLDPVALGDNVTVTVTFTDNNLVEAFINWGDTTDNIAGIISGQTITWEYTYNFPGVYTVSVLLVDACDRITEAIYQYVVIYNPDGGFVTGGGWFLSPPGAYVADPLLEGKANFGFVSKYVKGANIPSGTTEFQFKAGDLNFNSYEYEWLVIAGAKAKFKGEGTINGEGAYGFMISAIDGALTNNGSDDKMRIKIWDEDEIVVYDNELGTGINGDPTTILGGGSIVIHNPKDKNSELSEADLLEFASEENQEPVLNIFPNPVAHFLNIEVTGSPEENIQLKIFNALGELKYSSRGLGMLNEKINVTDYSSGFYLIAAQVNDKLIIRKLLKNN